MEIAPLALVVLLGYGLLIAVSLTTWTAVAYFREDKSPSSAEQEPRRARTEQERPRARRTVSNDEVRGARSRRVRGDRDPFSGEAKPVAATETVTSSGAVTWKPDTDAAGKRSGSRHESSDEDAFERFLNSRQDDFDIR